jgi:hypothetical protein
MYWGRKFDGTCYFGANQVGLDVSFCWYVPSHPLLCLACWEKKLMNSGCDGISHCGGSTYPHPPTKGISVERMDDILLTYLRHPPNHFSDGSGFDRPRSSDERQEHRAGADGICVLVVSYILVGDN